MSTGGAGSEGRLRPLASGGVGQRRGDPRAQRPDRYRVREQDGAKLLVCVEAPTVTVRFERGLAVSESAARSAEPGTIFLDGAAQCAPFADPKRPVYNLDHHEGCVRAFTLATCEQAMVLIRKFQDLRKRDWTVRANDADLDVVLAVWVLFNHLRLNADDEVRAAVMPLLRLEGAIDTHGLDMLDFLALPEESLRTARAWMDRLRRTEARLRERGGWDEIDLAEYTADRLRDLDALVYASREFEAIAEIEELERVALTDASIAVACRADLGIYEIERQLRRFHGDRLGMIVLQKNESTYSLRQVDPSLPVGLDEVYERLNLLDPAAASRASGNRWGGSSEIGGSPRASGTRLSLAQVLDAFVQAYRPPGRARRVAVTARVTLFVTGAMLTALAAVPVASLLEASGVRAGALTARPQAAFTAVLALLCALCLAVAWRRAPGLYGLRRPAGAGWWIPLPFALAGALLGGVWAPAPELLDAADGAALATAAALALALPACAEILFRGLALGRLARSERVRVRGRAWLPSRPVVVSAVMYTPWIALPLLTAAPAVAMPPAPDLLLALAGALLFGTAAGSVRVRSESLLAAIAFHWLGAAALVTARLLLA